MAVDPDPPLERYKKTWSGYDRADRRRVMRAVNRMQPLDDPAEAALAIVFARRQRRMWTRWWWAYALLPGVIAIPRGWEQVVGNLLVGGVIAMLIALAFAWRARRSAQINAEVVAAAQHRGRSGSPKKRAKAGTGGSKSRKQGKSTRAGTKRKGGR